MRLLEAILKRLFDRVSETLGDTSAVKRFGGKRGAVNQEHNVRSPQLDPPQQGVDAGQYALLRGPRRRQELGAEALQTKHDREIGKGTTDIDGKPWRVDAYAAVGSMLPPR